MDQIISDSDSDNCIEAVVSKVMRYDETQELQSMEEMPSSSSSSASASLYSCSNASNNKIVITSPCDSSSSSSGVTYTNIECHEPGDTMLVTSGTETSDLLDDEANDSEINSTTNPQNVQLPAKCRRPIILSSLNSHIICRLCLGYLIDATTIVDCLHSFCRSCLIKHLATQNDCPRCEITLNTTASIIKSDTILQAIVYKLVPGLYEKELIRRRAFYKDRPQDAAVATPEQRGDDTEQLIFSPSDCMSISLEYADMDNLMRTYAEYVGLARPRYLQCPAMCTVGHLKKFVYCKYEINSKQFSMDIMYKVTTTVLLDHYTLMDVAYIYTWKRDTPMQFYFRLHKR